MDWGLTGKRQGNRLRRPQVREPRGLAIGMADIPPSIDGQEGDQNGSRSTGLATDQRELHDLIVEARYSERAE